MIKQDKPSFMGEIMPENVNRAFLYGESVFTTMRMVDGKLSDWEYHFDRLKRGVEYVYGPFTDEDWIRSLYNRLLAAVQGEGGEKVIRLSIYRNMTRGQLRSGMISSADLRIHMMATPFDHNRVGKSLRLRSCSGFVRPYWWPSYLKAGNYLETILAQKVCLKPEDDDILFLSPEDTIWESSVANVFFVRHNILYTAPAGPNVLEGVMRRKILSVASEYFEDCIESETTMEQAFKADAVFGANSIRGLFLITKIDDHEINIDPDFIKKFEQLNARVYG
jgi:branched-chain amino acid aminotransferase